MDALPNVDSLPSLGQIIVYVFMALGALIAGLIGYRRGKVTPQSEDFVITGASITDVKPMQELAHHVGELKPYFERAVIAAEEIRDILKREATMEDLEREAEAALERALRRRQDEEDRDRRGR